MHLGRPLIVIAAYAIYLMVRLQKRISHGLSILQYYTTKEWHFLNDHFQSLHKRISEKDNEEFFTDMSGRNIEDYFRSYICGIREFVCKEDPSNLPRARKIHKIRYFADRVVKMIFFVLLTWFLYSNYQIFTRSVEYLDQSLKRLLPNS